MPRGKIELPHRLEEIAVLDPNGIVDEALEPQLSPQELRKLYHGLVRSRRFDERLIRLQRQGRIGTYGPSFGQEAASLGPASQITPDDWFIPSFRETAGMLWRGWEMHRIMLWWAGHEFGATVPQGLNDTPIAVPVGTQVQQAAGVAFASRYRGDGTVVLTFIGDGATAEGDFHEAMNFAGVFRLPLICIIQNNQWAISLPRCKTSAAPTLAQRAIAYGIDGIQADGNDILAMIVATREAAQKARAGEGPTLIEAVTYRMGVHTTADDPKKYRSEEEVEPWKQRDPILRFSKYLEKKGVLDEKGREEVEQQVVEEIRVAVEKAEQYKPDPLDMFRYHFAEMPPHLVEQMREAERAMMPPENEAPEARTRQGVAV
ncbi:MAG: pyruvate dehydrogenase (acetyl-transferring) E1 component subunit alpha [Phycisphaerae bacterium]|nr:pyruvate dehydrogenase (acetyl-transferring) E1 component subunit alpha [Phycisphaerae bacterium]NUQ47428.1 pyruvate dehydrogenase (acetyl-transferring) E1 component subunit alpha [Phycisphaerae bacterium]